MQFYNNDNSQLAYVAGLTLAQYTIPVCMTLRQSWPNHIGYQGAISI